MKEEIMKLRDTTIDIAKGLGIILVVYGHVPLSMEVAIPIYLFHMPLFFFLSGIFWRDESLVRGVYKKIRTVLVPYFFFAICGNFLLSLQGCISARRFEIDWLRLPDATLGPLWFLISLMWCYVLHTLIFKAVRNNVLRCMVVCAVCVLAICIGGGKMFHFLHIAMFMLFYYSVGNLLKTTGWYDEMMKILGRGYVFAITLVVFVACCFFFDIRPNVSTLQFYHPVPFFIGSWTGIFSFLAISKYLASKSSWAVDYIRKTGQNSLFVLGFHFFMIFSMFWLAIPISQRIGRLMGLEFGDYMRHSYIFGIVMMMVSVWLSNKLADVCNRWIPWMFRITGKDWRDYKWLFI